MAWKEFVIQKKNFSAERLPRAPSRACSVTCHYANKDCRRQIEKSLFAQIEMSLSTASVGEYWADDGDYDEPDGDRPDGRIARSGRWQDQDRRGVDVDGAWSAS